MPTLAKLACLVVILTALHLAKVIVVPLLLAVTFAIAFQPLTERLARRGVPNIVAALITVAIVLASIGAVGTLVVVAVGHFAADAPRYGEEVKSLWESTLAWLNDRGLGGMVEGVSQVDFGGRAAEIVRVGAVWMSGVAGDLFNVLLLTVFIQLEATTLKRKLSMLLPSRGVSRTMRAFDDVQKYLRVKFLLAVMNGVLLGLWCWIWGLSNPVLWGVAAFALNFVPIIGSLIAAVPPILLAIVELGFGSAIGIAAGYGAVNVVVDNVLEPRLMGRTLDVSPLVLLLSLLVWGFILGPVGALLSFPLTVAVRIYADHHPHTRWIGLLLAAKTHGYEDLQREPIEDHAGKVEEDAGLVGAAAAVVAGAVPVEAAERPPVQPPEAPAADAADDEGSAAPPPKGRDTDAP